MIRFSIVLCLLLPIASKVRGEETTKVKLGDISLTVPKSWKQEQPKSRLRLGQFKIPAVKDEKTPAELTVFFFGATSGSASQNIDRWINQFQAKNRKASIVQGKSAQGEYYLVEISGTYNSPVGPPIQRQTKAVPNSRMLGVILQVAKKGSYYLKLTGPDKTVANATKDLRKAIGGDEKTEKKKDL